MKIFYYLLFISIIANPDYTDRVWLKLPQDSIAKNLHLSISKHNLNAGLLDEPIELTKNKIHHTVLMLLNYSGITNLYMNLYEHEILDLIWKYGEVDENYAGYLLDLLHINVSKGDLDAMYLLRELYRRNAFFEDNSENQADSKELDKILADSGNAYALIRTGCKDETKFLNVNHSLDVQGYKEPTEDTKLESTYAVFDAPQYSNIGDDPKYCYYLGVYYYLVWKQPLLSYFYLQRSAEYGHQNALIQIEILDCEAKQDLEKLKTLKDKGSFLENDRINMILLANTKEESEANELREELLKSSVFGLNGVITDYSSSGTYPSSPELLKKITEAILDTLNIYPSMKLIDPNSEKISHLCIMTTATNLIKKMIESNDLEKCKDYIVELSMILTKENFERQVFEDSGIESSLDQLLEKALAEDKTLATRIGKFYELLKDNEKAISIYEQCSEVDDAQFLLANLLLCQDKPNIKKVTNIVEKLSNSKSEESSSKALFLLGQKYSLFAPFMESRPESLAKKIKKRLNRPEITPQNKDTLECALAYLIVKSDLYKYPKLGEEYSVDKVIKLLESSQEKVESGLLLAHIYIDGIGVKKDLKAAETILKDIDSPQADQLRKVIEDRRFPGALQYHQAKIFLDIVEAKILSDIVKAKILSDIVKAKILLDIDELDKADFCAIQSEVFEYPLAPLLKASISNYKEHKTAKKLANITNGLKKSCEFLEKQPDFQNKELKKLAESLYETGLVFTKSGNEKEKQLFTSLLKKGEPFAQKLGVVIKE